MTQMTVDLLKEALPRHLQGNATQDLADHINNIALDPEVAEHVRENFLTYSKVLGEGRFKTQSYLDAVTYVTHKLMGYNNQDSYIRTFPQRYQALVAKGVTAKDLSAYVAAYHSNKLVNLILEQSIIPTWLLNRDVYQRAINTQFELMTDVNVSAKVRSDAANSILTHLKQPETQKVEIDVGVKQDGGIQDLVATMNQLARQQQELIQKGVPARHVARDRLTIEGEVEDAVVVEKSLPNPVEHVVEHPVERVQEETAEEKAGGGFSSLFKADSPSPSPSVPSPGAASAASAASKAQSTEGGVREGGRISLFDPGSFPIGDPA